MLKKKKKKEMNVSKVGSVAKELFHYYNNKKKR